MDDERFKRRLARKNIAENLKRTRQKEGRAAATVKDKLVTASCEEERLEILAPVAPNRKKNKALRRERQSTEDHRKFEAYRRKAARTFFVRSDPGMITVGHLPTKSVAPPDNPV